MSKSTSKSGGRPQIKGSLRNFKLVKPIDDFLAEEAKRTGRDMTLIVERSLEYFKALKPAARDAELAKAFSEAA